MARLKVLLGMLSCQHSQNAIDGKKRYEMVTLLEYLPYVHNRIILNPSEAQKQGFEAATFAENEVYGVDILVSSSEDGKVV